MQFSSSQIIVLILLQVGMLSCNRQSLLSESDRQVINTSRFDIKIIKQIRTYTDSGLNVSSVKSVATACDSTITTNNTDNQLNGIIFQASSEKAERMVKKLGRTFRRKGYQIYISELNISYSPDKVTVLKTHDKFDPLRFEATNGENYGLCNEDIISQLKEWDTRYTLNFTGVGIDFIEAEMKELPKDMSRFCRDLYAFCPDIVDQGTGTIEELKTAIVSTNRLFLWWD